MSAIPIRFSSRSILATVVLALMFILTALISPAVADPGSFIVNIGTQGIRALGPEVSMAERMARLWRLFQEDFDIPGIGLFALGRYRLSATPEEQREFLRVYPDFTVRALSNRLDEYGGASLRVTGSRVMGNDAVVNSEIIRANGTQTQFDWYLSDIGGQYRITDVAVGGVSMKVALRDQFASWIESNGHRFSALLSVLRQQVARAM